ncbi:NAD(+) diphosphatase [Actinobacillus equuli subsp. equuli]|uniref:NAD-capped RNA hydrolase NudC n=1 Tax=Actinobacillus equuli subsp. equuli TaxID=202947 RepID=A0A9X4JBI1_ACTEU|nr:NAD(+) diphosphatase [Actinobacillus equuli]MDE8033956.1 NAD(+) diphosphatase [Actinobacillus equuli subsp. equuli]
MISGANMKSYWVLVHQFEIALKDDEIPFGTAKQLGLAGFAKLQVGTYQNSPVFLVQLDEQAVENLQNFTMVNLRSQIARPAELAHLLHRAVSLNHFLNTHKFCGKCGAHTELANNEIAVHCPDCQHRSYPTISPSIIVAVRRGRQILLANHLRHKGTIYTTLAGFVEAGEAIETTVQREVWEESGLKIKNIRYFGSQPWAFPNSLMLGFLADYDSGEITLQEEEIFDAKWFDCDQPLPELPPEGTIALELIKETLKICREER